MKHCIRLLIAAAALAAVIWTAGCTGSGVPRAKAELLREQLADRGLIVGFEGLQPYSGHSTDYLTQDVARAAGLAHSATSGNRSAHLPFIELAHKNGQPIYIVGYSMGASEARRLARLCARRDIPVRGLFLLDPPALSSVSDVPDNVHRLVVFLSGGRGVDVGRIDSERMVQDPSRTSVRVEGLPWVGHMRLPYEVAPMVMSEVLADLRNSARPDPPWARGG